MKRHKADIRRFGDYDLHDLIELDQQTVGVMIQADAETCQVLTNRNAVSRHTMPQFCFRLFTSAAACLCFARLSLIVDEPL